MEVSIEEDYIIFKIKNNVRENDLTQFYTPEYFKFIGEEPEIFISENPTTIKNESNSKIVGGFFQDEQLLTVPYKYFVYLVDPIYTRIKTIQPSNKTPKETPQETPKETPQETPKETPKEIIPQEKPKETINLESIRSLFQNSQPIEPPPQSIEPPQPIEPPPQSIEQPQNDEIILKFIKTEDTPDNGKNLSEIISSRDPTKIDVNKNGLTYQEVYNITRVEKYISSEKKIYQEDVYYLNGKWIIMYSNGVGVTEMGLDVSNMENSCMVKCVY